MVSVRCDWFVLFCRDSCLFFNSNSTLTQMIELWFMNLYQPVRFHSFFQLFHCRPIVWWISIDRILAERLRNFPTEAASGWSKQTTMDMENGKYFFAVLLLVLFLASVAFHEFAAHDWCFGVTDVLHIHRWWCFNTAKMTCAQKHLPHKRRAKKQSIWLH